MDTVPPLELLESVHAFPGVYQIKAIGSAHEDFVGRVLTAAREELAVAADLSHTVRTTAGGRHVAVTMELSVQTAEQVRAIYERVRQVRGLVFLF